MKVKSKTTKVIWMLALLMTVGLVKAQNNANPIPFANDQAKQDWINANPAMYQQMGGQAATPENPDSRTGNMTEVEKQAWLAAHPDQRATQPVANQQLSNVNVLPWGSGDKDAWIAAHPAQYDQMTGSTAPSYPWGDDANKAAWKAAHPAEFEALNRVNAGGNAGNVQQSNSGNE